MKRLFVVFVIVMMLFVVGCKGVSVVNAKVNESGELILYMSDGSSINAGMVKGEDGKDGMDGKDGEDGEDGEDGVGIAKAAVNDSGDLMIRLTDDTLINAGEVKGQDGRDGKDGKDGTVSQDNTEGKGATNEKGVSDQTNQPSTTSGNNNNITPLTTSEVNENNDSSSTQLAPEEEGNSQETTACVLSDNEPPSTEPSKESPNELGFQIQIDDANQTLISYDGTASVADLRNESFLFVGANAFKDNEHIETVILPDCVAYICEGAFEGCSNLTTLDMPPSVTSIGNRAFKDTKLSGSLNLYASSVSIGNSAFENTLIDEIVLSNKDGLTLTVFSHAFANCSALTSITMADFKSSLELQDNAFYQVENLSVFIKNPKFRSTYPEIYTKEKLGITGGVSFLAP